MSDIFSLNLRPNFRLVFAKQINFKIFWAWAVWDWFLAEGGGYILLGNGLVSRIPRAPFHPISCISFPQETLHSIFCIANTAASSLSGLWLMWGGEKSRRRGDLTTIEVGVVNIVEEVESWGRLYSIVERECRCCSRSRSLRGRNQTFLSQSVSDGAQLSCMAA